MQAHPDWEVRNKGINGERSDRFRPGSTATSWTKDPQLSSLLRGVNDVYQGRPASEVTRQLEWMWRARDAGIRVIAGYIIPYNTATPEQNGRMREINARIRRQAADLGLGFVDTRAAVAAPGNPDMLSETADRLHPSPAGYRLMADAIRPVLENVLR